LEAGHAAISAHRQPGLVVVDDQHDVEDAGGSQEQASIDVVLDAVTNLSEEASMTFSVNQGGTLKEILRIDGTAGYVGIGTTNPGYELQVIGDVDASGDILSARFVDRNSTGFYVDPASTSYLNIVQGSTLYDRDDNSYYLDPASISLLNAVYSVGQMRSPVYYDYDNISYYLDPASTSNLSVVHSDNQVKSPIFYDYDNVTYYLDPASTSTLDAVHALNQVRSPLYYDYNNTSYYLDPASTSILNDVRASVFYDGDNTSYFVDADGTSTLNGLSISTASTSEAQLDLVSGISSTRLFYRDSDDEFGILHKGTTRFRIESDGTLLINETGGNVGVGTTTPNVALDITGDIEYTGTLTDVSDRRLKENIAPVDGALDKIQAIAGVTFNMMDTPERTEIGLIAQDVQAVLPEAVTVVDPGKGLLGVSYQSLIPVLIEAVKELKTENDALKARILALEQKK
ncbi:MAG: tail fiber domain-containing protein, partial [Fidelibacterota bacterium]